MKFRLNNTFLIVSHRKKYKIIKKSNPDDSCGRVKVTQATDTKLF